MSRRCHAAGVAIAVLLSGCASSDPWTRKDTVYEAIFVVALSADAYTTTRIQYVDGRREGNPIVRAVLGSQPRTSDTWQAAATVAITHALIARALPERWRRYWQTVPAAIHGAATVLNCNVGHCP